MSILKILANHKIFKYSPKIAMSNTLLGFTKFWVKLLDD